MTDKPKYRRYGELIRKHRKAKGLTLKEAAKALGVSLSHLNNIESAGKTFNTDMNATIVSVLGVDPGELERLQCEAKIFRYMLRHDASPNLEHIELAARILKGPPLTPYERAALRSILARPEGWKLSCALGDDSRLYSILRTGR